MTTHTEDIRIGSTPLVAMPGFCRYMALAYKSDPQWALHCLTEGLPDLPAAALLKLLAGKEGTHWHAEGDVLVIRGAAATPKFQRTVGPKGK